MTEQEIRKIGDEQIKIEPFHIFATTAYHIMGDLSRSDNGEDNLACISGENGDFWIGMWVTGFGFFNVLFPKNTVRNLTDAEIKRFENTSIQINSNYPPPLNLKIKKI